MAHLEVLVPRVFDTNAWYATSVWVYGQVVLSVMSGI